MFAISPNNYGFKILPRDPQRSRSAWPIWSAGMLAGSSNSPPATNPRPRPSSGLEELRSTAFLETPRSRRARQSIDSPTPLQTAKQLLSGRIGHLSNCRTVCLKTIHPAPELPSLYSDSKDVIQPFNCHEVS